MSEDIGADYSPAKWPVKKIKAGIVAPSVIIIFRRPYSFICSRETFVAQLQKILFTADPGPCSAWRASAGASGAAESAENLKRKTQRNLRRRSAVESTFQYTHSCQSGS